MIFERVFGGFKSNNIFNDQINKKKNDQSSYFTRTDIFGENTFATWKVWFSVSKTKSIDHLRDFDDNNK